MRPCGTRFRGARPSTHPESCGVRAVCSGFTRVVRLDDPRLFLTALTRTECGDRVHTARCAVCAGHRAGVRAQIAVPLLIPIFVRFPFVPIFASCQTPKL